MTEEIGKALVNRWVRPAIRELSAYHVQEAEGLIKLDAMENPYRWPDTLREEWLGLLRTAIPIPSPRASRRRCASPWRYPTMRIWCSATVQTN